MNPKIIYGSVIVPRPVEVGLTLSADPATTDGYIVHAPKEGVLWVHGEGMGSVAIFPGANDQVFLCERYGWLRSKIRALCGLPSFRWVHETPPR